MNTMCHLASIVVLSMALFTGTASAQCQSTLNQLNAVAIAVNSLLGVTTGKPSDAQAMRVCLYGGVLVQCYEALSLADQQRLKREHGNTLPKMIAMNRILVRLALPLAERALSKREQGSIRQTVHADLLQLGLPVCLLP